MLRSWLANDNEVLQSPGAEPAGEVPGTGLPAAELGDDASKLPSAVPGLNNVS